jgi:hypothetical protein
MKHCSNCKAEFDNIYKFCLKCGGPIIEIKNVGPSTPQTIENQKEVVGSLSADLKIEGGKDTEKKPTQPDASAGFEKKEQLTNSQILAKSFFEEKKYQEKTEKQLPDKTTGVEKREALPKKTNTTKIVFAVILITVTVSVVTGAIIFFLKGKNKFIDATGETEYRKGIESISAAPSRIENAFPYEGGQLGEWSSKKGLTAFKTEGDTSRVAFSLKAGEKFDALVSNIHVDQIGIIKVKDSVKIFVNDKSPEGRALEQRGLQKGDIIALISPAGEGYCYIWVNSKIATVDAYKLLDEPPHRAEYIRKEGKWTLWVKVKNNRGAIGWIMLPSGYDFIIGGDRFGETAPIPAQSGGFTPSVPSTPAESEKPSTILSDKKPDAIQNQQQEASIEVQQNEINSMKLKEIKQYLQEGKRYYSLGKYELCISKLEEVLKREASNKEAQNYIKNAKAHLEEIEKQFKNPVVGGSR